jgi:hypothetical protein
MFTVFIVTVCFFYQNIVCVQYLRIHSFVCYYEKVLEMLIEDFLANNICFCLSIVKVNLVKSLRG